MIAWPEDELKPRILLDREQDVSLDVPRIHATLPPRSDALSRYPARDDIRVCREYFLDRKVASYGVVHTAEATERVVCAYMA